MNSPAHAVEHLRAEFGGMGSFNDVSLLTLLLGFLLACLYQLVIRLQEDPERASVGVLTHTAVPPLVILAWRALQF
jgi:hypothetical protein